tara:strand:+ start:2177 stop:2350 length:174 start_codon:yes stop_codon:yes gene_type:complete
MVFVPAGSKNVVPRCRLVALKTLIDTGVRLASDAGGNHFEVHHVMAGWCLMTLGTVH